MIQAGKLGPAWELPGTLEMARILILDAEEVRAQQLRSASAIAQHEIIHARDPATMPDAAGERFAVIVVAVRDPLTSYLEMIRALKSHVNEPAVLAIFSGGELPADLALVAAQIYGADSILYQPHSAAELIDAVDILLRTR